MDVMGNVGYKRNRWNQTFMLSSLVVFIVPCESVDDPSASIFFNSVPYGGELSFRIGWLVTIGKR